MQYIALEFENDRTLVVSTREASGKLTVQSALQLDCQGQDDQTRAQTLKHDLNRLGLGKGQAIVVVQRSEVEIRELNLPPAPDNELPDMVRLLARQEFATLNENWKLDFIPLSQDANLPRRVLAAGMSPQKYSRIVDLVEGAGLKLKHVVLRPFESVGLLPADLLAKKNALVVDLNGSLVDMAVIADGQLVATRSVRVSADGNDARAKTLMSEIRRTIASASSALGNQNISEVVTIGNTADDEALVQLLQQELDLEIQLIKPFELVDTSDRFSLPEQPWRYSALLGSLVRTASAERHPIDFQHPRRPVVKQDGKKKLMVYAGLAAAVALLAFIAGVGVLWSQSAEIAELKEDLRRVVEQNEGTAERPGVVQITGRTSVIDQWLTADSNWLEEINSLSGLLESPDDSIVDIMDIRIQRGQPEIDLKGRMADQKQRSLVQSLENRFTVTVGRWDQAESDPSYQVPFDFKLRRPADQDQLVAKIDARVETLMEQARNENNTNVPSNETSENQERPSQDSSADHTQDSL